MQLDVNYHHENDLWWATTKSIPGFQACSKSPEHLRDITLNELRFRFHDRNLAFKETHWDLWSLHRESGLTWNELRQMFGVSKRTMREWSRRGVVSSEHEELLNDAMYAISEAANATEARAWLSALRHDNPSSREPRAS